MRTAGNWCAKGARAIALGAALVLGAGAEAATVTAGDLAGGTGGITYTWQIEIAGPGDGASVQGNVGSKSWADPSNPGLGSFGLNGGWTHTSNWIYLSLAQPAQIAISLAPDGTVPNPTTGGVYAGDLVPALSLWSGVDNDGADDHFFEQGAVPHWVDAPGFAWLGANTTGPGPFAGGIATILVDLPAGVYTLDVGGHDDVSAAHRAGYLFSVQAVPEPGTALLVALGLGGLLGRQRRR